MGDFEGEAGCGSTHHFACKCREAAFAKLAKHALAWQIREGKLTLHGIELAHTNPVLQTILQPFCDDRQAVFEQLGNVGSGLLSDLELGLVEQMHELHATMTMLKDDNYRLRESVAAHEEGLEVALLRQENKDLKARLRRISSAL